MPLTLRSAAMRSGLVGDLPYPIDPDQIVEVDPYVRRNRGSVPDDLHRSNVSCLGDRDDPTHVPARRRGPMREVLADWILGQSTIGVDVKDPGVVVKGLFEFSNVIVIEAVDLKLHHANDFVVIFGSHRSLPLAPLEQFYTDIPP